MLLFFTVFIPLFAVTILCVGLGLAFLRSQQKQQVRTMLRRATVGGRKMQTDLLFPEDEIDPISGFLNGLHLFSKLSRLLEQAGVDWTISKLLCISAGTAFVGAVLGLLFVPASLPRLIVLPIALGFGSLPIMNVLRKRRKKFAKFEEQFPEALDFLARSMRAGHAFSISLEMLVADSPDPLQSAFKTVVNDVHLGSSLDVALAKLALAVPLIDVRFFVSSVILQQGTGGNLSEVLNSMGSIIRERFRLKGQVKAASAHGKVTGLVLSVMPVVVGVLMLFSSPAYVMVLFQDPDGKKLLYGAIAGQIIGYLVIKKIVDIKV